MMAMILSALVYHFYPLFSHVSFTWPLVVKEQPSFAHRGMYWTNDVACGMEKGGNCLNGQVSGSLDASHLLQSFHGVQSTWSG